MRFAHLLALTSANAETATTLSAVESEHPHWFTEPEPYRPCPASVGFPGGRHACLGLPEYGHRQTVTVYWRPRHLWQRFNRGYF
jgi:hypothetical protein